MRSCIYIILTLLLGIVLVVGAGAKPLQSIVAFLTGIFGSLHGFGEVFVKATPLILISLGLSIGMRSGFVNIGGEGQMYVGAIAASIINLIIPQQPNWFMILSSLFLGAFFGGIWALIPGVLKSKLGISEIINTLMMNYIALALTGVLIRDVLQDRTDYLPQSALMVAELPKVLPPSRLHLGFFVAVLMVFFVWVFLDKTRFGYEMKVVGANARLARCSGISISRNVILAAFLSGALGGIAGAVELLGVQHRLLEGITGGNGYTAILVALLARNRPLGVLGVAIGFSALQVGANSMQRQMAVPSSIVAIITGFIVLLILGRTIVDEAIERVWRKIEKND